MAICRFCDIARSWRTDESPVLAEILAPCRVLMPVPNTLQELRSPEFAVIGDRHAARRGGVKGQHHYILAIIQLRTIPSNQIVKLFGK